MSIDAPLASVTLDFRDGSCSSRSPPPCTLAEELALPRLDRWKRPRAEEAYSPTGSGIHYMPLEVISTVTFGLQPVTRVDQAEIGRNRPV